MIEESQAIPLLVDTLSPATDNGIRSASAWRFDRRFLKVDGGYVPQMLEWESTGAFREQQQFQVVNGVWIFRRGDSWHSGSGGSDKSGSYIQGLELVDLAVHPLPQ